MTIIPKERSSLKPIILSEVNFFFAVIESELAIEKDMHSIPEEHNFVDLLIDNSKTTYFSS